MGGAPAEIGVEVQQHIHESFGLVGYRFDDVFRPKVVKTSRMLQFHPLQFVSISASLSIVKFCSCQPTDWLKMLQVLCVHQFRD